ncbi:kinase C and casein kinase substrate in neurons 2-like isoform X1 [Octopus vulgaris]|uniref:Kinase C and casein kinase substrate in neurons 2-like isoform X1 n=1 Tax=Octopus vulgaris TaxID=6645 RepID=A0AA36BAK8_OCTVU|nr:kinase C and casein kinase substrate in neurons 2-like isoform X1 [Octopus vulgaris]
MKFAVSIFVPESFNQSATVFYRPLDSPLSNLNLQPFFIHETFQFSYLKFLWTDYFIRLTVSCNMSVMDEYNNQASESFWEIGKYNRSVKRIENGSKLCDSLRQLIETRSDIEKSYAKQLSQWSRKWNDFLEKGPEYGTTQTAWRSVLTEADKLCELHTEVAERLMTQVYLQVKQWNKDNYHRTMMNFRECKDKEDNFRRAQKPWMKRYNKLMVAKKEYHSACKQERSTANQENNAKGDPSVPVDQVKKLGEKLTKCKGEVEASRDKYKAALHDLNSYNPKYIEEMTFVFNECQEMERRRLTFFKQMLFEIHQCLDLSQNQRFAEIYRQFYQEINCGDCEKDLRWWSNIYGAGMSMNWPEFVEYSPELHNITKTKKPTFGSNEGITITGIKHNRESYAANSDHPPAGSNYQKEEPQREDKKNPFDEVPEKDPADSKGKQNATVTIEQNAPVAIEQNAPVAIEQNAPVAIEQNAPVAIEQNATVATKQKIAETADNHNPDSIYSSSTYVAPPPYSSITAPTTTTTTTTTTTDIKDADGRNPFGDPDSDDWLDDTTLVDDNRPGVPVRALYDYSATAPDELTFKAGEMFTKLSDPDELGWCKGRKDGRVGLYPATYVEPL